MVKLEIIQGKEQPEKREVVALTPNLNHAGLKYAIRVLDVDGRGPGFDQGNLQLGPLGTARLFNTINETFGECVSGGRWSRVEAVGVRIIPATEPEPEYHITLSEQAALDLKFALLSFCNSALPGSELCRVRELRGRLVQALPKNEEGW
jgi:hypothetical protein